MSDDKISVEEYRGNEAAKLRLNEEVVNTYKTDIEDARRRQEEWRAARDDDRRWREINTVTYCAAQILWGLRVPVDEAVTIARSLLDEAKRTQT